MCEVAISSKYGDRRVNLLSAGAKRAVASLTRDYCEGREPMPKPGDLEMMLDEAGRPRFIWRTTEVTIKPLVGVDEAFAWDEGEGPDEQVLPQRQHSSHVRLDGLLTLGPHHRDGLGSYVSLSQALGRNKPRGVGC